MSKNITNTVLTYGVIMALASIPLKRALSAAQLDSTNLLLRVGFVSTLASVPVGLWALARWPQNTLLVSGILTALAFGVKEHMLTAAKRDILADYRQDSSPSMIAQETAKS